MGRMLVYMNKALDLVLMLAGWACGAAGRSRLVVTAAFARKLFFSLFQSVS